MSSMTRPDPLKVMNVGWRYVGGGSMIQSELPKVKSLSGRFGITIMFIMKLNLHNGRRIHGKGKG